MPKRFDILVLNYRRLNSFFENFWKLKNFNSASDRVTILSSSPTDEERNIAHCFMEESGIQVRYLERENRGIDQLARAEYFSGKAGSLKDNTEFDFIFHMQDHYLDTASDHSRYGERYGGSIKGDVVPDKAVFDLDLIESKSRDENIDLFFNDRLGPCWFKLREGSFIAPSGGNFIVKRSDLLNGFTQELIRRLILTCDDTYDWAVFAEFMWGYIFFREGKKSFDLNRGRLFTSFRRKDFHLHGGPSNRRFRQVFRKYHRSFGLPYPLFLWEPLYDVALRGSHRLQILVKGLRTGIDSK